MMQWWQALLLGTVQGITEFLPVSSSGHLVLLQAVFGLEEELVLFDVVVHVGTLLAVIGYFWERIWEVGIREWLVIAIATLPAVVVGVSVQYFFTGVLSSLLLVSCMLVITGCLNFYADRLLSSSAAKDESDTAETESEMMIVPRLRTAVLVGIAQAAAIMPGISRSGSTVAAGLGLGLSRRTAFTFSFFLAIPAIMGAFVLQLWDLWTAGVGIEVINAVLLPLVLGGSTAFIVGWASLSMLERIIERARIEVFAYYCWGAAAIVGLLYLSSLGTF